MKRILALFCLALTVAPLGAQAGPARGLSASLGADLSEGLKLGAVIGAVIDISDQDRHRRRGGDNDNDSQRSRGNDFNRRDDDSGGGRREERNDNRMDRAYAIASRYGRVQDVWPKGGSIFGARVSTDRGRIELEIDVNSGSAREM